MIEKRKPLSSTAKRAGWIGCNILLKHIPQCRRIFYLKDGQEQKKFEVVKNWKKVQFLQEKLNSEIKGWLLDVILCIEKLEKLEFTLEEIYQFENFLKEKHPENNNVKAKIRQQLQYLRDKGYIEFISRGKYKVIL